MEWGCSGRRAGSDEVAWLQSHDPAEKRYQLRNREVHVGRLRSLPLCPIHPAYQLQLPPVQPGSDPGPNRAEGVEAFGATPLPVHLLKIATSHVVHTDVPTDGALGSGSIHIADALLDDHTNLGFELHPGGDVRQQDGVTVPDE